MTQQTNSLEEEIEEILERVAYEEAYEDEDVEKILELVKQTISQEKEKWYEEIKKIEANGFGLIRKGKYLNQTFMEGHIRGVEETKQHLLKLLQNK